MILNDAFLCISLFFLFYSDYVIQIVKHFNLGLLGAS